MQAFYHPGAFQRNKVGSYRIRSLCTGQMIWKFTEGENDARTEKNELLVKMNSQYREKLLHIFRVGLTNWKRTSTQHWIIVTDNYNLHILLNFQFTACAQGYNVS